MLRRYLTRWLADEGAARQWLDEQDAGWAEKRRFSFAVLTGTEGNRPIGHVVVKCGSNGVAEVGYWTAVQARGRGIAARALETATQWALGGQDLVSLTLLDLLHAEDNQASCRVAEKCGYVLLDVPAEPPAFPAGAHRHVRTPVASGLIRTTHR